MLILLDRHNSSRLRNLIIIIIIIIITIITIIITIIIITIVIVKPPEKTFFIPNMFLIKHGFEKPFSVTPTKRPHKINWLESHKRYVTKLTYFLVIQSLIVLSL